LHPNSTKRAKDFEEHPAPKKFGFLEYIPQKYEGPKLHLSLGPKGNCSAGDDVSDDAWLL
jgi:hypothetical protein